MPTAAGQSPSVSAQSNDGKVMPKVKVRLNAKRVNFGDQLKVTGRTSKHLRRQIVFLEKHTPQGIWVPVAKTRVGKKGLFAFNMRPQKTLKLRVTWQPVLNSTHAARFTPATSRVVTVKIAPRIKIRQKQVRVSAGKKMVVAGQLQPVEPDLPMALQIKSHNKWKTIARTRTGLLGRFRLTAKRNKNMWGQTRVITGANSNVARSTVGLPTIMPPVHFRTELASWYGAEDGYGKRTACGHVYSSSIHGVAHKTLPCGKSVVIRYRGRTMKTRVIDRGPFIPGRNWDLSNATAHALGFDGVQRIQVGY